MLVAEGQPLYQVAEHARIRVHRATVSQWVRRYLAEGLHGLKVRPGRGRKPDFSPRSVAEARMEVALLLQRSPRAEGVPRTRWRLQDIGQAVAWLRGYSEAGIFQVLKRLGFRRKQALPFVRSPDPTHQSKWQAVLRAYMACQRPDQVVLLFMDEFTYYRLPHKAPACYSQGKGQPRAYQYPGPNTKTRLVSVLNALAGQVLYRQRAKIGHKALIDFYAQVRAAYPAAERLYLVQDNWPVHTLPDVLAAMRTHGLTSLFLPTYASWLNPIEKLWRWLRQDVLHLHRLALWLDLLRTQVAEFLDQFQHGSEALLRYVGLLLG
ncbi:MAG: IS630 family transposase [Chloroflexi bacterium]|nr:IS630 family transposase [Chloroflexota bacterium]